MATNNDQHDHSFPIVGIGGSAGSFEAVRELLEHLATDTGLAFIFMQHQSPDFDSQVVPLLASKAIQPVIDRVFDFEDVVEAHRYMERNANFGKIILRVP